MSNEPCDFLREEGSRLVPPELPSRCGGTKSAILGGMTERLTVREIPEGDYALLKAAAAREGMSLSGYTRNFLHELAMREHNRQLLASIGSSSEGAEFFDGVDAVAEVRAIREERDAHDARHMSA